MDLTEDDIEHLVSEVKDWQLTHASLLKLVRLEEPSSVPARPVGVSIVPTQFPKKLYNEAVALQPLYNELYIRAACNYDWLSNALGPLLKGDAFLSALWDIHLQAQKAGVVQQNVCGFFRSDYMIHAAGSSSGSFSGLKQVEMNTFSVAGACHAERVAHMHRHIRRVRAAGEETSSATGLLNSSNTAAISDLLSTAHRTYARMTAKPACVLMIVQSHNFNIADERPIEYGLWDQDIPCYRCEWQAILEQTTLTAGRTLLFHPKIGSPALEVSVIYYRAGYAAGEYDEVGKQARLSLELSRAIKCPDVLTHLTTFKAIQRALTGPGAVEHFLSPENAAKVRTTFMGMHNLDTSPAGMEARKLASNPDTARQFVLKPNLEGGGHNVYREDIPAFLASMPAADWEKFILMSLIEPPPVEGILMTPSEIYAGPVVSELGVLGTCMWKHDGGKLELIRNCVGGWTFKTKPADVDEMSVVKGYGCFDSPALIAD